MFTSLEMSVGWGSITEKSDLSPTYSLFVRDLDLCRVGGLETVLGQLWVCFGGGRVYFAPRFSSTSGVIAAGCRPLILFPSSCVVVNCSEGIDVFK